MDQSKNASDRMIELKTTEELDDRIPRHLPDGIHVAHKTANWDNATHDGDIARIAFDYLERWLRVPDAVTGNIPPSCLRVVIHPRSMGGHKYR